MNDFESFNKKLGDSTDLHEIFIYFEDVGIESDVIQWVSSVCKSIIRFKDKPLMHIYWSSYFVPMSKYSIEILACVIWISIEIPLTSESSKGTSYKSSSTISWIVTLLKKLPHFCYFVIFINSLKLI